MYSVFHAASGTVLDATTDRSRAAEWAERYSQNGGLFLVLWNGKPIAAYLDGVPVRIA